MKKIKLLILLFPFFLLLSCVNSNKPIGTNDKHHGVLIVAHKTDNTIHIIERKEGKTLQIIETGIEPHEVEISTCGKLAVVCNYGNREVPGNTLSVYDIVNSILLRTIDLGVNTRPHGMQWIAGTQKMFVTTEGTNNLLLVDVEKGEVLKSYGTEQEVSHMVSAIPELNKAFVTSIRTGNLTIIDLNDGAILEHVYSGKGAEGVASSPDGKEIWVTNRGDNSISVFDPQTHKLIDTLDCGDFPIRIKFSPNGSKVLVSNAQSGEVAIFNAHTKSLIAEVKLTVPVPQEVDEQRFFASDFKDSPIPIGLVVPDNDFAYVANTNSDLISEIDLKTYKITRHFITGKQPDGINFSPVMPLSK